MKLGEIYKWYFDLDFVQNKKSARETLRILRKYIERLGPNRTIKSVGIKLISNDRLNRLKNAKPSTSNSEVSTLREMLSQAFLNGLIKTNPIKEIRLLPCNNVREVNLQSHDIDNLVVNSPKWLAHLILTATQMPMRRDEISSLTWREVDFNTGSNGILRLGITRTKTTGRAIPLHPKFRELLEELRGNNSYYVFEDQKTIKRSFDYEFRKSKKKAGLPNITFHDLRHVCISNMFAAGIDQYTIMKLAGHKTDAMFRRYMYLHEDQLYNLNWG